MFDVAKMLKKGILGFLTGLAAVIVLGVAQSITSYNPVVCSADVAENCTPKIIVTAYMAIVPVVTGALVSLANWLKNRGK